MPACLEIGTNLLNVYEIGDSFAISATNYQHGEPANE
jgi:hypothetical protein